jgi:hypothetical protein
MKKSNGGYRFCCSHLLRLLRGEVFVQCPQSYLQEQIWDILYLRATIFEQILASSSFAAHSRHYLFVSTDKGDTDNPDQWEVLSVCLHSTADAYKMKLRKIWTRELAVNTAHI